MTAPLCRAAARPSGAGSHRIAVPEVTTWPESLERDGIAPQASRMESARALLKRLFEPLCIAAYVTWAAVFADVIQGEPSGPFAAYAPALPSLVMLGFLGVFVATHFSPDGSVAKRILLVTQIALGLFLLFTV